MGNIKKRNITVDIIKTIAIFGVVMIHTVAGVLTNSSIGGADFNFGLFWGTLVRGSVPLFFMCSGALLLDPGKELTLKKLYLHNIARIVAAMLVWATVYKIYHLYEAGDLGAAAVFDAVKHVLVFDQEFHFYYLHIILVFYVFLPITRFITAKADKKLIEYILAVWFLLGIVYPTLMPYYPLKLFGGITGQWMINLTYASLGYGISGYYLTKYPLKLKTALIMFFAGFLFIFAGTFYMSAKNGALYENFLQGTSIGVAVMSAGIFSLSGHIKPGKAGEKAAVYISKASFSIYLSHLLVLYILKDHGITADILPAALSVPLLAALITAVCLSLYFILSRIPVLKKWII